MVNLFVRSTLSLDRASTTNLHCFGAENAESTVKGNVPLLSKLICKFPSPNDLFPSKLSAADKPYKPNDLINQTPLQ